MRLLILKLLFLLTSMEIRSQIKVEGLEIIEQTIKEYQGFNKVFYADSSLDQLRYSDLLKSLSKRKYSSTLENYQKGTIILSKSELHYIKKQLKTSLLYKWPDSLFENSFRFPLDSLWTTLQRNQKLKRPATPKEIHRVWQFMKPIILRNNEVALIFHINICGGECGNYEFSFYRKTNGIWKKWVQIKAGEF